MLRRIPIKIGGRPILFRRVAEPVSLRERVPSPVAASGASTPLAVRQFLRTAQVPLLSWVCCALHSCSVAPGWYPAAMLFS